VCSCYLGGKSGCRVVGWKGAGNPTDSAPQEFTMSARPLPAAANETREQRIETILKELRPKIDAVVRQMVERAVDVPEAEEFGAIDFEFRDAGQKLATEVRQASVASRKKRGTSGAASPVRTVSMQPSFIPTSGGRS
jgi:hypothetical protein